MIPEFALGLIVGAIAGVIAGCILYYYIGTPQCEHQWEKIIDDHYPDIAVHTVVHMCKKCGKRKTTRS